MNDNDRMSPGDAPALQTLARTHQRALFRLAYAMLGDAPAADRAVQQALLAAVQRPDQRPPGWTIETWLASLTLARCRQRPTWAEDPAAASGGEVWRAYLRLSAAQRRLLALRYFLGYTPQEIARISGWERGRRANPETVVESRLNTARERLIQWLSDEPNSAARALGGQIGGINHAQARLLLRSNIDRRLGAGEWVALESHLEGCTDCRNYQRSLQTLERDITRALTAHLESPPTFPLSDPAQLAARHQKQQKLRRKLTYGAVAFGALLILALGARLFAPEPGPQNGAPLPAATPSSTPVAEATPATRLTDFQTTLLFQSRRDGNEELYLLEPGAQPVNLTASDAQDTNPVWSPDGEWIAFLSDRHLKREIYVLSVSGNHLTQLTDEPEIDWVGPIAWSPDGQRLVLAGQWQGGADQTWLYQVQVNGGAGLDSRRVTRLSYTRGARNPRWSVDGNWLAYEQLHPGTGAYLLIGRQMRDDRGYYFTELSPDGYVVYQAPAQSFAWSPNKNFMAFISDSPYNTTAGSFALDPSARSRLQISDITSGTVSGSSYARSNSLLVELPISQRMRDARWATDDSLVFLQQTQDTDQPCWQLKITRRSGVYGGPYPVRGLCATEEGLSASPWSPDGHWLVMEGVQADETTPALYALPIHEAITDFEKQRQQNSPSWWDIQYQTRLIKLETGDPSDHNPLVRPLAPIIGIHPQPIQPRQVVSTIIPGADLQNAPGWVYLANSSHGGPSQIIALHPDGSQRRVLSDGSGSDTQPLASPDGSRLAFVSTRTREKQIFVMPSEGGEAVQVSNGLFDSTASSIGRQETGYLHMVWSPDGEWIAAIVMQSDGQNFLFVFPSQPKPGFADIHKAFLVSGEFRQIAWSAVNNRILLAHNIPTQRDPPQILYVDWNNGHGSIPRTLFTLTGWDLIEGFSVSSTGQFALVGLEQQAQVVNELRTASPDGANIQSIKVLNMSDIHTVQLPSDIDWLPDGRRLLVRHSGPPEQRLRSIFGIIDTARGIETLLWDSEDAVYFQRLSPDGRWLLYAGDNGLWMLDIDSTLHIQSVPTRLSGQVFFGIDWSWGK